MLKIQKKENYVYVRKSFRFQKELAEELTRIANQNNLSVNKLVILCLNYALNNIELDEKDTTKNKEIISQK